VGSSLFECTLPLAGGGCADQFVKLYSRQATACSAARLFRMNVPPLVSNAQMILAILLAKAMAATLAGLRANNAVSQGDIVAPRRACRNTAVAPTTRRERSAGCPSSRSSPSAPYHHSNASSALARSMRRSAGPR